MDARLDPLAMLGLQPGDAVVLRNGGGRVSDEIVAALVAARHLLGVERLAIVGHTDCRMTAPSADVVRAAIAEAGGPDTGRILFDTAPDAESGVRVGLERARTSPYLEGLVVDGYVYDVSTGELKQLEL
jgi:carbonic anhydrase